MSRFKVSIRARAWRAMGVEYLEFDAYVFVSIRARAWRAIDGIAIKHAQHAVSIRARAWRAIATTCESSSGCMFQSAPARGGRCSSS